MHSNCDDLIARPSRTTQDRTHAHRGQGWRRVRLEAMRQPDRESSPDAMRDGRRASHLQTPNATDTSCSPAQPPTNHFPTTHHHRRCRCELTFLLFHCMTGCQYPCRKSPFTVPSTSEEQMQTPREPFPWPSVALREEFWSFCLCRTPSPSRPSRLPSRPEASIPPTPSPPPPSPPPPPSRACIFLTRPGHQVSFSALVHRHARGPHRQVPGPLPQNPP
jgi:hypothetical protein